MLAGQEIAIVSDYAGTTTDPVKKSIELMGIGPVIMVDTAGIDDSGELGRKRIAKTLHALKTIDFAVLVIAGNTFGESEKDLIKRFEDFAVPYVIIHNKSDILSLNNTLRADIKSFTQAELLEANTISGKDKETILRAIQKRMLESAYKSDSLLGDILNYGDFVLLVTPIDIEAPEGRMILPQVQAIRDILDNDAVAIVLKERELDMVMRKMQPRPALVVTDSQVFLKVDGSVPADIPLTSFSIMLARHKGDFENYLKGTPKLSQLQNDDRILILESCTHQVSCDDIGRVKIPRWVSNFSGKKLEYDIVSGLNDLPREIHDYALVIQCGGCVLTRKQIINRLKPAVDAGISVTNYGMAIAYVHGIYQRAVAPFLKVEKDTLDYL